MQRRELLLMQRRERLLQWPPILAARVARGRELLVSVASVAVGIR